MTLDQFADLMVGLGYKSEKGERLKIKVEVVLPSSSTLTVPILEGEPVPVPVPDATEGDAAPVEMEIFYTFTWAPKQRFQRPERGAPQAECEKPAGEAASVGVRRDRGGDGKSGGHKGNRDGKKDGRSKPERREDRGGNPQGAKSFEARSPRIEKPIDPDNPFAVLAALKNRS
jgi:ATP-dependent RNA helicase SUPV3L1/SUV3